MPQSLFVYKTREKAKGYAVVKKFLNYFITYLFRSQAGGGFLLPQGFLKAKSRLKSLTYTPDLFKMIIQKTMRYV